jgi:hypothetical protein
MARRLAGRIPQAEEVPSEGMGAFPDETGGFVQYGYCANAAGSSDEAAESITRSELPCARFPNAPEDHWVLAGHALHVGAPDRAAAYRHDWESLCRKAHALVRQQHTNSE